MTTESANVGVPHGKAGVDCRDARIDRGEARCGEMV
jgi:hypothetical protein